MKIALCTIIALALSASVWADEYIIPINQSTTDKAVTIRGPVTRIVTTTKAKVTFTGTAIGTPLILSGAYQAYTDDKTLVGVGTYTGNGGGGDPGGKLDGAGEDTLLQVQPLGDLQIDNMPWGIPGYFYVDEQGPHIWRTGLYYVDFDGKAHLWNQDGTQGANLPVGIDLKFHNNVSGSDWSFRIALPLCSGTLAFTGNDSSGYRLNPTDSTVQLGGFVIKMGAKAPASNPQLLRFQD